VGCAITLVSSFLAFSDQRGGIPSVLRDSEYGRRSTVLRTSKQTRPILVCMCVCMCFRRTTSALELDETRMKISGALGRLYHIAVVLNATSDIVSSMLTEDRSVIFRSICLFVGYVCL
jgi:hypothetical protein